MDKSFFSFLGKENLLNEKCGIFLVVNTGMIYIDYKMIYKNTKALHSVKFVLKCYSYFISGHYNFTLILLYYDLNFKNTTKYNFLKVYEFFNVVQFLIFCHSLIVK